MHTRSIFRALLYVMLSLTCFTKAEPMIAQTQGDTVSVALFSVTTPAGKGWKTAIDSAANQVSFSREKSYWMNKYQVTQIIVLANIVLGNQQEMLIEDSMALGYIEGELRGMQQEASEGRYRLEEVNSTIDSIGGRRVHTLKYKKALEDRRWRKWAEEAALHVWFPEDFSATRRFYVFLVSEFYMQGHAKASVDLSQIKPIIASFRPRALSVSSLGLE